MKALIHKPALATLLVAALFAQQAAASSDGSPATDKPGKAEKAAKANKKPAKAPDKAVTSKFLRGSEESAGERSARLKRECKGAVNAGACAGYTR
jgi:hypothetical protein